MAIKEKEPSEQFIAHTVSGYKPKRRPWNLSAPISTANEVRLSEPTEPAIISPAKKAGDAVLAPLDKTAGDDLSALKASKSNHPTAPPAEYTEERLKSGDAHKSSPDPRAGAAKKSSPAEKASPIYLERTPAGSALSELGWKLADGISRFTRVPHSFTDCLEREEFSHREYRFLLLILRETLGWGRPCVALRSRELLDRTKIPERHLRDTIKTLQSKGVILVEDRKTENGQSLPSAFALNPKYFEKYEPPAESAGGALSASLAERAGSSLAERAGEDPRRKSEGCQNGMFNDYNNLNCEITNLKKELKKEERKSLSQDLPKAWIEFTSTLTEKARERADRVFLSLKTQFPSDPLDEIAECAKNLERFGAPDGTPWSQISSPIGLMESSWPQLRDFFRKKTADAQKLDSKRNRLEAERIDADEQASIQTEQSQLRRQAFFEAFPDDAIRREAIQKYLVGFAYKADPESIVGQGIAIERWWQQQNGTELEPLRIEIRNQIEKSLTEAHGRNPA